MADDACLSSGAFHSSGAMCDVRCAMCDVRCAMYGVGALTCRRQAVSRMDVLLRNYRERGGDEKGLAELLALRGVVLERMDDRVGARRDYLKALRVDAKCEEALYNLGCLLINEQEWRAAKVTTAAFTCLGACCV
eukprot:3869125-Rhodomonas_salina.2